LPPSKVTVIGTNLLIVENLNVRGLAPLSFSLKAGECMAVRGASGSGKTLLLRAIADLDPAEGNVTLDGTERGSVSGAVWRKMVRYFQSEPGFWAPLVGGHLKDACLIENLGLPADALDWDIERLSTGEKQRISLARGFADAPPVLLLDEPTSGLDQDATELVETMIIQAVGTGAHALVVSHDPAQAKRLASRTIVIADGTVKEDLS
jgi:putative ABC transport system ATP-binding protein